MAQRLRERSKVIYPLFVPIAVELVGVFGPESLCFLKDLGRGSMKPQKT